MCVTECTRGFRMRFRKFQRIFQGVPEFFLKFLEGGFKWDRRFSVAFQKVAENFRLVSEVLQGRFQGFRRVTDTLRGVKGVLVCFSIAFQEVLKGSRVEGVGGLRSSFRMFLVVIQKVLEDFVSFTSVTGLFLAVRKSLKCIGGPRGFHGVFDCISRMYLQNS